MTYYVYILASQKRGTLYTGMTNNVASRGRQHREGRTPGFTKRYGVKRLVHIEVYEDVRDAIHREKRLKSWNRAWKIALIEKENPDWDDLYERLNW